MLTKSKLRRAVMLLAVAVPLGATAPASAAPGWHSIIPRVAPKVDVAQGAQFETAARDSSGISFAESWQFAPAADGHVLILNRMFKDGKHEMALDVQRPGGPADAGNGSPVGTAVRDGSASQQWKLKPALGGLGSYIVNRQTGRALSWNGSGPFAYTQSKSLSFAEFSINLLG